MEWLHNLKNPTDRLARWAFELFGYNYKIEFQKATNNIVLDALSRKIEITSQLSASIKGKIIELIDETDEWYYVKIRQVGKNSENNQKWRIGDNKLYFFRSEPLKLNFLPNEDHEKLTIPKKFGLQILKENHDNVKGFPIGT